MGKFIEKNLFKGGILLLVFIMTGSASYYYLIFRPNQDRKSLYQQSFIQDQVTAQITARAQQLKNCINNAQQTFVESTGGLCETIGIQNSSLCLPYPYPYAPAYQAIVKQQQDQMVLCATLYK